MKIHIFGNFLKALPLPALTFTLEALNKFRFAHLA